MEIIFIGVIVFVFGFGWLVVYCCDEYRNIPDPMQDDEEAQHLAEWAGRINGDGHDE